MPKRLSLWVVTCATFFLPCAFGAEAYRDAKLPAEQRVKDLLSRMTLEEKIEQLIQKDASGIAMQGDQADPASLEKLFHDRSPGVLCVHFGDDLHQSARRLAAGQRYLRERTRWGIPALTVNEGLHGVLAKGATIYPQFLALGCTWNTALAEEVGSQIAAEASAAGLNHLLTPMVEVVRDPRWGRVEECIGESPYLVGRVCTAYTLGIQGDLRTKPLAANKALAMLKTFAGYSAPVNGINIANCPLGERELRSTYFPPVEEVIRETGVLTIPSRELALWNRQMQRVVEPGTFTVMVGSSAEAVVLRGAFRVADARP
jgi:beta-glucosidase